MPKHINNDECYSNENQIYLDFLSSYGALPFGHNPPELLTIINQLKPINEPNFAQLDNLQTTGQLAERLISLAPGDLCYAIFSNSDAETIEVAIQAVRAATGRLGIISATHGFHGKKPGTLSVTTAEECQELFGESLGQFYSVSFGDTTALEHMLKKHRGEIAAVILEPIQREESIYVPPQGYLQNVRKLCDEHSVLFILDETQIGLGRAGYLFTAEKEGIAPDCLTLAKALGGGIIPIGACLLNEKAHSMDFSLKHCPTFSDNTLACRIGLRVLELLTDNDQALVKKVADMGQYLKCQLEVIAARFPKLACKIHGQGLLIGIEFQITRTCYQRNFGSYTGLLAEMGYLIPILASYLLNEHKIRTAPILNGSNILLVEPPLTVTKPQCDTFIAAMEETVSHLAQGNTGALVAHLVGRRNYHLPERMQPCSSAPIRQPPKNKNTGHVAFLIHPLDQDNYLEFDESLAGFNREELKRLEEKFSDVIEPFVISSAMIESITGKQVFIDFIAVPLSAEQLISRPHNEVMVLIKQAIELAKQRGAKLVGLGGFTSIITRGGIKVVNMGIPITTGNSYTVVSAIEACAHVCKQLDIDEQQLHAVIIGAGGSCGSATARLLSCEVSALTLVGNPTTQSTKNQRRFLNVYTQIIKHTLSYFTQGQQVYNNGKTTLAELILSHPQCPPEDASATAIKAFAMQLMHEAGKIVPLTWSTNSCAILPLADIVVAATSSTEKLIEPALLKAGSIVCNLSRPTNIGRQVCRERPDVLVIDGGVIAIPGNPDLGWNFGFSKGLGYACMAETMLLGLEEYEKHASIGSDLNDKHLIWIRELAQKHGFHLAGLRSFDRPLNASSWKQFRYHRAPTKVRNGRKRFNV